MNVKDALAILARNARIEDDGDRRALAEFLGRDADAPDPFGPLPESEPDNEDHAPDGGNESDDEKTSDGGKTSDSADSGKTPANPATVKARTSR